MLEQGECKIYVVLRINAASREGPRIDAADRKSITPLRAYFFGKGQISVHTVSPNRLARLKLFTR